ncbi:MAG: hypothetical protein JRE20_13395 [Deltaproteobacteria bacterium]|nr:hypothetical protein [Deltaproteobacteria bacterium]
MSQTKICPDCRTEYYPHIECCADCGALLISPDESKMVQEEKKRCSDKDVGDQVQVVRAGSLKWIDELFNVLIDSGIPCVVNTDAGCNKGGCRDTYRLLVSPENVEKANERIEEYCMEIHPEIKDSKELISQGKCPACSCAVDSEAVECPDCGLTLLIIEE